MRIEPKHCIACATALIRCIPPLDSRERAMCPKCGYVAYQQPKIAAGTIPERDGRIVLVRRGVEPRKGFWSFPCGFMEIDEDVRSTAHRETEEETGLKIEITGFLGVYSYATSAHGVSVVIVAYRSRVLGGELTASDDVTEARWVRPDEIPWDDLAFQSSRDALKDWLGGRV